MNNRFISSVFSLCVLSILSCQNVQENYIYPDCITEDSTVASFGCGNLAAYQFIDQATVLAVQISADHIELTQECQSFDIESNPEGISVAVEVAGGSPDSIYFNYCTDVAYINQGSIYSDGAVQGKLTISSSVDRPMTDGLHSYFVTIKIDDLVVPLHEDSRTITGDFIFKDVRVGWLPG